MEPSDQQVDTLRCHVLAMVKDNDDRMGSSHLQELMDIVGEVKCFAWDGSIKSNILGSLETSRGSCRDW